MNFNLPEQLAGSNPGLHQDGSGISLAAWDQARENRQANQPVPPI